MFVQLSLTIKGYLLTYLLTYGIAVILFQRCIFVWCC